MASSHQFCSHYMVWLISSLCDLMNVCTKAALGEVYTNTRSPLVVEVVGRRSPPVMSCAIHPRRKSTLTRYSRSFCEVFQSEVRVLGTTLHLPSRVWWRYLESLRTIYVSTRHAYVHARKVCVKICANNLGQSLPLRDVVTRLGEVSQDTSSPWVLLWLRYRHVHARPWMCGGGLTLLSPATSYTGICL